MDTLLLKIVATPLLIAGASLAGRRWGPVVSGWLVGLPFTSAPITFFLALDHGLPFAAAAAAGTLAGTISQAAFILGYAWLATRSGWFWALLAGCLGFAVGTAILQHVLAPAAVLFPAVIVTLAIALWLLPDQLPAAPASPLPLWDLPLRMVVATTFVLLLTGAAAALGPHLTGLLAPFPLYGSILAVFAHRLQGPAAAIAVLRGLLFGLFAFATFFLVLASLLPRVGIIAGFALAIIAVLAVQGCSLWLLRHPPATRSTNTPRLELRRIRRLLQVGHSNQEDRDSG